MKKEKLCSECSEPKKKNDWWRKFKIYINPINWLFLIAWYFTFKKGNG